MREPTLLRKNAVFAALAVALLAWSCRYRVENGGYNVSRFRENPGLVSVPPELRGLVSTNREAARSVQARLGGRDLRFVIIGDTVSDRNATFKEFLREIAALDTPPAFIVHLGDRVASPIIDSFGAYLKDIADLPCPIIHVDGNHDVREEGERISRAFFGEQDFFFDLDDKRFVFMGDARPHGTHGFTRAQLGWLEEVLGAAAPAQKYFFAHVPPRAPFKRISPGLASLFTPALENEGEFLDILARHHVVLAAFGHRHVYAPVVYNGVLMVITGGGGQRNFLEPDVQEPLFTKKNHYTLVDIPRSGPDEWRQGILSCMGKWRETLSISSFSQPAVPAVGADLAVILSPYPVSNLGPFRPGDPLKPLPGVSVRKP